MDFGTITKQGLVLLGCGKMGTALLEGWLACGLSPQTFTIIDPNPSDRLKALSGEGLNLNTDLPSAPAVVVLAVKPQLMKDALPALKKLGNGDTMFVSIAAGTSIAVLESSLGKNTPIIRTMPNTPATIGRGITALVGNAHASTNHMPLADTLMCAVGETVHLTSEDQMDAVTGVSGSGPAYVFHLIETLAKAGEGQGLPADMALQLACATVAGAGALVQDSGEAPGQLRINVTSPNGTTAAGLKILMNKKTGLQPLVTNTVKAAADRSRTLKNE